MMSFGKSRLGIALVAGAAGIAFLFAAEPVSTLDPVARLAAQVEKGEVTLEFQKGPYGYLPSLLKNLGVDPSSQVLVFSKTSFQADKIGPKTPRALYFNESVSVGSVQNSDVYELIGVSPGDGLSFYTLDVKGSDKPKFEKRTSACTSCHGPLNQGVPGMMVTSVYPNPDGTPFSAGVFFPATDHRSPFEDRWGGWYVTGTHGSQRHRGNAIAPDPYKPADLETKDTQNLVDLSKKFDRATYLSGSSDIVALMALEHQTGITNYLARLNVAARGVMRDGSISGVGGKKLDALVDETVAYMLFSGEMPILEPIQGNTEFAKKFSARGPRDSKGRSLRDFDLKRRMFRYPLSYMIYHESIDAMPASGRDRLYRRLYDVLTGKDASPKFAHLSSGDRAAILEIVRDTRSGLPEYWK